jgi:hypothetical protein
MSNIIFAGCSFTYGEGLWRETGDTKQNSVNQKYLIDNRWITTVSNHFDITPITKEHNGGNHIWTMGYVLQEIDAITWNGNDPKLVIFQTTQFGRHTMSIDDQIQQLEKMVIEVEAKNIPIRFIHWIWPDLNDYEMQIWSNNKNSFLDKFSPSLFVDKKIPPYDGNKLSSKIIRDRTIYILNNFNFQKMVNHKDAHTKGTLANKYTLAGKFDCGDFHMNQEGHDVLANEIINYIENNKLL